MYAYGCAWYVGMHIACAHTWGSLSGTFSVYSVPFCLIALRQGPKLAASARLAGQKLWGFPHLSLKWGTYSHALGFPRSWVLKLWSSCKLSVLTYRDISWAPSGMISDCDIFFKAQNHGSAKKKVKVAPVSLHPAPCVEILLLSNGEESQMCRTPWKRALLGWAKCRALGLRVTWLESRWNWHLDKSADR